MLGLSQQRQRTLCLLLLAASTLTLWVPVLDRIGLNPDESQYEATASYLVGQDVSAFLPNGAPGIFLLFKGLTLVAGPYPSTAARIVAMLAAFAIAWMIMRLVDRETNIGFGLVAGLLFLHYAPSFEGFAVNREWGVSLVTMAGLSVFLAVGPDSPRRRRMLVAAGVLCGLALWFKLQAVFIVFVVPAGMLLEALAVRSAGRLIRDLPWFAAGGLSTGVAYLGGLAYHGTLGLFLKYFFSDVALFVEGNEDAVQRESSNAWSGYVDGFMIAPANPVILWVAYVVGIAFLAHWLARGRDRRSGTAYFATYLWLAMLCVQLGGRYYGHYYQLMLPAVALLVGCGAFDLARRARESIGWRLAAMAVALLLLSNALIAAWLWRLPFGVIVALGSLAAVAHAVQRPLRRVGIAAAALVAIHVGALSIDTQFSPRPASLAPSYFKYTSLASYVAERSEPGDRLFVWGWAPEIYSLTRLEAASHITFCQYIANDYKGAPQRQLNEEWAGILMAELTETRPRFIVDASRTSWFETERFVYDLRNFPEFELNTLLREHYRQIARADDCVIWERTTP